MVACLLSASAPEQPDCIHPLSDVLSWLSLSPRNSNEFSRNAQQTRPGRGRPARFVRILLDHGDREKWRYHTKSCQLLPLIVAAAARILLCRTREGIPIALTQLG